jgi:hypothetical protein
MWTVEHNIETSALPEQVWRLWADVERWPEWNGDIERIELHGSFATGGRIMMTPSGKRRSSGSQRQSSRCCSSTRPTWMASSSARPIASSGSGTNDHA